MPRKQMRKQKKIKDTPQKPTLLERWPFRKKVADLADLESGATTVLDIISPTTVDTKNRDYIIVDDVYHAYLYVTGYGYETTVAAGWLTPLVEAGEGISISFYTERQVKEQVLSKIAQTIMFNRSRMRDVDGARQDYEELDSATSAGVYLKEVINRQGEDMYYMHVLIEATAQDTETLEQRVTAVENLCTANSFIARRCDYRQEQSFLSMLPLNKLDGNIQRQAKRNTITKSVAAAFPFASYELSDKNGVFLGLNMYNRSPVFLDFYNDSRYINGNTWIGGSSGAGKTFALQCMGCRLRQQGKQVIYIVPKKGHEFRPMCEELGGQFIRLAPSSPDCINIMEIRRTSLDVHSGLRNLTVRDDSVLADKISRLIIFYSLLKKDLTDEDKNYLDTSLVECYGKFGITFDNRTLFDEDGNLHTMPTLADWYHHLRGQEETKHLSVVLTRFVTGSASSMGGQTNVDVNSKYIVIDTSGMPDDLILPGIFWATDLANDLIMGAGSSLSALIADELWALVGANSNPLAAAFVQEMVKTIRGLGGIAITSTQGMQDLFGLESGKYGKGILDSSRIKLIMQMEEQEARLIQDVMGLSEDEVRQITRFRRGEGLLCIGYNHVPIVFHATKREYAAITTSPTDLYAS